MWVLINEIFIYFVWKCNIIFINVLLWGFVYYLYYILWALNYMIQIKLYNISIKIWSIIIICSIFKYFVIQIQSIILLVKYIKYNTKSTCGTWNLCFCCELFIGVKLHAKFDTNLLTDYFAQKLPAKLSLWRIYM